MLIAEKMEEAVDGQIFQLPVEAVAELARLVESLGDRDDDVAQINLPSATVLSIAES